MHGLITKKERKKSFFSALLARLQRASSLTDRPVLFLSSFPAMEIAATPLSRCLFDGDAATQRISRCWSWQEGSSTFISLRRKEIAEKRCMNHTDSLGSSLKTLLVCLLARSVALLEVHLIYSKSILLLYSLQCMLIVYGDMASAWDGMRICFWHPRLISRKQYSELNGWLIKLINEAYMWWLPPASCIGLRFRLCKLQCMHHVERAPSSMTRTSLALACISRVKQCCCVCLFISFTSPCPQRLIFLGNGLWWIIGP